MSIKETIVSVQEFTEVPIISDHEIALSKQPVPKFVKANVIAEMMDVKEKTVLEWGKKGMLPAVKIGGTTRFDLAGIIEQIERGEFS